MEDERFFFNEGVTTAVFHKDSKVEHEMLRSRIMLGDKETAKAVQLMK